MRRAIVPGLIGLAVGLALYAGYTAWRAVHVELDEARLAGAVERAADLPKLRAGAVPRAPDTLGDFVERPVFWDERRPPSAEELPAEPEDEPQPVAAPKDLEVSGVFRHAGEWFALAQFQGQPLRLREGDSVGGWQVKSIMADNVVFSASGGEHRFELFKEIKVAPAKPEKKTAQTRRTPNQRASARSRILQQRAAQRASQRAAETGTTAAAGEPEEEPPAPNSESRP